MANFFDRIGSSFKNAVNSFKETYFSQGVQNIEDYITYDARILRYSVYWAFYENTAYDEAVNSWAHHMKQQIGLYKHIRSIYNPSARIGDFWRTHLMGGFLDPKAGDGTVIKSALPIVTDNEAIRGALANLWEWSNWKTKKNLYTLWGTVLGDVAIKVVDDPTKERVYLDIIHPSNIADVTFDNYGNVKEYVIIDYVYDPREGAKGYTKVLYKEVAKRNGDDVIYQTFLNNQPYAWNGLASEWVEPYGFIPLVMNKHIDIGKGWGKSELSSCRSKIQEADDLASKLGDQIRKLVDSPMLLTGISKPKEVQNHHKITGETPTTTAPKPEREELPILYASNPQANAVPLTANLDISSSSQHILSILKELEREYPELQVDLHESMGQASGKALRIARAKTEEKAQELRANYDAVLVRAQKMALSIGGFRKYDGFTEFDLGSYQAGTLEHSIGKRPVFQSDPMDDLERDEKFWTVATQAKNNGVPVDIFLRWNGFSEDKINELLNSEGYKMTIESKKLAIESQKRFDHSLPDNLKKK